MYFELRVVLVVLVLVLVLVVLVVVVTPIILKFICIRAFLQFDIILGAVTRTHYPQHTYILSCTSFSFEDGPKLKNE